MEVAQSEIERNKLCVVSFIIALVSHPIIFYGYAAIVQRVVFPISLTTYLYTLFKPEFVHK